MFICEQLEKLLLKIIDSSPLIKRLQNIELKLSGSLSEGSFLSRWFFTRENNSSILADIEADVETTVGEAPIFQKHCFKDIHNKPGFTNIQLISENCSCPTCMKYTESRFLDTTPERFLYYIQPFINENGFLMSKMIKARSLEANSYFKDVHVENARMVASFILDKPVTSFVASNFTANLTKATLNFGYYISIKNTMDAKISLDFSFNFKLHWIPDVTNKWLSRHRHKWPPIKMLHDQLKYSYVIAKPSCTEKNNENTIEFRYSFAHIERRIFTLMSDTQRLIYFIFKSMFYKWIIPIDQENIGSYIAKTIMLWIVEEYPPQHVLWKQDLTNIINVIRILFRRLVKHCQRNYLPYFFETEINVFDCMPIKTIELIERNADRIEKHIEIYIPKNIRAIKTLADEVVLIFKVVKSYVKDIDVFRRLMEMYFSPINELDSSQSRLV